MVHIDIVADVLALQQAAAEAGFQLGIASAFRDYTRQLTIWNAKASGQRPVLSRDETPLDTSELSETELMFAILRWSALPGASRHHWGTDFDVFDAGVVSLGHRLELTFAETQPTGAFAEFYVWLDQYLAESRCFFRPYRVDSGGVAPEPWHLSPRVCAEAMQNKFDLNQLRQITEKADMALKDVVLANLDVIYQRFIAVPQDPLSGSKK